MAIPEATYHYNIKQMHQENPDQDQDWKRLILEAFKKHTGRYGYRHIHAEIECKVPEVRSQITL